MYNMTHYETHKHYAGRNDDPRLTLVHRLDETRPQAGNRSIVNRLAKLIVNR